MDEPTNHLDIWACAALERSIREFEGTVLVVSHDRYFLNQVVDRLLLVSDGRVRLIEGDYSTYQYQAKQEAGAKAKLASVATVSTNSASVTDKVKKKRKFPYRKLPDIEREIGQCEAELVTIEAALGEPETWKDADLARNTQGRYDSLKEKIVLLYEHWEEASELNS